MTQSAESTAPETPVDGTKRTLSPCAFELYVYSKYDDATTDAFGPTLSIAISHALPELRHLAHSRAVFGARRQPKAWRSYGCWEIVLPDEDDRPSSGYDQLAIRQSVDFDDKLEAFDVLSEFDGAEGRLRYRAQDLGDDDKSMQSIAEGVREYIDAAYQLMLWDPKAQLNIAEDLDELFLDRDWTSFVSPEDLQTPAVSISDVRLVGKSSDDEWLVRFHYANGPNSGHELEFADLKKGRMKIRRNAFSALRSAVPAFRGDQLPQVYDALQTAIDRAWAKQLEVA